MEKSNDFGSIIGALLIGSILGVTLGVLFAPDKGSKTRSKLTRGAEDLADDLSQNMKNEAVSLRNKAEELEHLVHMKGRELAHLDKSAAPKDHQMQKDHQVQHH